jgi:hypothetical protein
MPKIAQNTYEDVMIRLPTCEPNKVFDIGMEPMSRFRHVQACETRSAELDK